MPLFLRFSISIGSSAGHAQFTLRPSATPWQRECAAPLLSDGVRSLTAFQIATLIFKALSSLWPSDHSMVGTPLFATMTDHEKDIIGLVGQKNWAGLLRLFMAHNETNALLAIISLGRSQNDRQWTEIASVVSAFVQEMWKEPIQLDDFVSWLAELRKATDSLAFQTPIPAERAILQMFALWPLATVCRNAIDTFARPDTLFIPQKAGVASAKCVQLATEINDSQLLAAFRGAEAESGLSYALGLMRLKRYDESHVAAQDASLAYRQCNRSELVEGLATSCFIRAFSLRQLARCAEAIQPAREAVELFRGLPDSSRFRLATALDTLAYCLMQSGKHSEAANSSREAVGILRALSQRDPAIKPVLADSLSTLVICLNAGLHYEEALSYARLCAEASAQMAESDFVAFLEDLAASHHDLAISLGKLGRNREATGASQRAVRCYRQLARRQGTQESHRLASSLNTLANCLCTCGKPARAVRHAITAVKQYLALYDRVPSPSESGLAMSLQTLARCFGAVAHPNQAVLCAFRGVTLLREEADCGELPANARLLGMLGNLARHLATSGRPQEALNYAQEATELSEHLMAVAPELALEGRLIAYSVLGDALRGPLGDSCRQDLRGAWRAYGKAIECAEQLRGFFRDEGQRQRVVRDAQSAYAGRVQTSLALWETEQDCAILSDGFHASERSRSRRLLDLLAHEILEPRGTEKQRAQWREVRQRLQRTRLALCEAEDPWYSASGKTSVPASVLYQIRRELEELERVESGLLLSIRMDDPEFAPDQGVPPLPLTSLRELQEGESAPVLVEWFIGPEEGGAFVLLPDAPLFAVRLPCLGVNQAIAMAVDWLDGYGAKDQAEARLFKSCPEWAAAKFAAWGKAMAGRLRAVAAAALWPVLQEIERRIGSAGRASRQLVLCPHAYLHLFPLHAAPLPEGEDLVTDRWEVTYAPSLSLLHRVRGRAPRKGDALLIGNPTQDLLFAGLESALFVERHPEAVTLYGRGATPEAFIMNAVDKALVHVSCHMTAANLDALRAGLVLGGQEVLRLPTLYSRLKVSPGSLVLLNGCESGMLLSDARGSWDYEGLPMAFLFAGARNVVSTLWKVYDLSSTLLLDRFHHERKQPGATVSGAMRAAADWLRGKSADGISDGHRLVREVNSMLGRIDRRQYEALSDTGYGEFKEDCLRRARAHANSKPNEPPFGAPVYWAAHIVTGCGWSQR